VVPNEIVGHCQPLIAAELSVSGVPEKVSTQVFVVLGIVLTLVWSGLLVWLFLRLLHVV
jgi:flagellar biogenesis protein FliO